MGSARTIRCSIWTLPFDKIGFSQLNTASAGIVTHCCFFSARTEEMPEVIALNYVFIYAYGTDTPSSSATSFTRIKISPAIGKIPSFPDLWLIALPLYPQDSGRQPFSALCRFLFSLARSFHRLLPRRKYPLDGHSVWLFWISPPLTLQRTFFLHFGVS